MDALADSIRTKAAFRIGSRESGSQLTGSGIQDVCLFGRPLAAAEVGKLANLPRLEWLAKQDAKKREGGENDELFNLWFRESNPQVVALLDEQSLTKTEETALRKRGTVAYVMNERATAAEAFILFRGEYDKRRDRVTPDTPPFLPPMTADMPRNRLGFAQWLARPENPLMSRVTVNRFWQELFGVGLVKTSGDFGLAGEVPSNQALLDWLAVDFRESGWDVKRLFKFIVTSATYRQAALVTPEKLAKDPENRLLSRGPRFRMDAEMVRDSALCASGLLVNKVGGPSVRPYQPPGIWDIVGMPQSDTRKYVQDTGESLYRRSVYTFWKRQAPPASMEIFNAPSREVCTVRRERTDTPLQALVTLNDVQFVEAARHLAQLGLQSSPSDGVARLDYMARRVLARPLTSRERKIIELGVAENLAHYRNQPAEAEKLVTQGESKRDPKLDAPTLAAYTIAASQLLNLDENLTK
jgi:hypothetical protein